jgi:group I intron endonuclease
MENDIKQKGIYKITNIINGKIYIGSTSISFNNRFKKHINDLDTNKHGNRYLQNAWNKYTKNSFIFEIIEIIDKDELIIIREQYYLDILLPTKRNIGYNICTIAGSSLGVKRSDEFKEKIRQNSLNMSKETRAKISNSLSGLKQSKETIDKRVKKLIGGVGGMVGKNHSKITKLRMSKAHIKNNYNSCYKIGNKPHNIRKIIQLDLEGNFISEWDSMNEIEKKLKISHGNISLVCSGKRNSAGGFKWQYLENNNNTNQF